jgi:biopolymer transport protein ExbD
MAATRRARVEIIPLIDVIFFLLATFVLFTLTMNSLRTLPVVLPSTGEPKEPLEMVSIQVSADGAVYWNREPIEAKEIPARLEHYKGQTESPKVVISGDENARFGATIAVFDQVRQAGITRVSVETRPRPTGK